MDEGLRPRADVFALLQPSSLPRACDSENAALGIGALQGPVPEWLGSGLQNRLRQFDSGRDLQNASGRPRTDGGAFFVWADLGVLVPVGARWRVPVRADAAGLRVVVSMCVADLWLRGTAFEAPRRLVARLLRRLRTVW